MVNKGGNFITLKNRLHEDNIDYSHFDPNRGKRNSGPKRACPLSEVLIKDSNYKRGHLKKRLIKEGILEYKCSKCGIHEWNNESLSLILDHINGVYNDNRIENLRLLCPNCNSQTDTFAGRNVRHHINHCISCLKKIRNKSARCIDCSSKLPRLNSRKVIRPSKEVLEKLVWEKPTMAVAADFGMSDKAIEKWCKSYGIQKPPRGYWQKKKYGLTDDRTAAIIATEKKESSSIVE